MSHRANLRIYSHALLAVCATFALSGCHGHASANTKNGAGPTDLRSKERVRIVLIGDTGFPSPPMEKVRAAIKKERKDLILAMGDLVYPVAPTCVEDKLDPESKRIFDECLGGLLRDLGAPVLLVLGNHDVAGVKRDIPREECLKTYAATEPTLYLPSNSYAMDLGLAMLMVTNTNHLDDAQAAQTHKAFAGHKGWKLMTGHHVYRTYWDKENENLVRPWMKEHGFKPDMFLNGHAHLLQFGIYDGIPVVTSGSTAKPRTRPNCPDSCGEGQKFGVSGPGYAVLDLTSKRMILTFHDAEGTVLYHWNSGQGGPKKAK